MEIKQLIIKILPFTDSIDGKHKILNIFGIKIPFKKRTFNWYKADKDKERIKEYWAYKNKRIPKGVVYTCITNDYDDINEIEIFKYTDRDWDYVFFTDNEEQIKQGKIGIWEVRPLQYKDSDNTRNQRWHKTNPHILFPEYEKSIWIDGNINILTKYIFNVAYNMKQDIMLPKHYKNNCIYNEYNDIIKLNFDEKDIINRELEILKKDNMPKEYGFTETNILCRNHLKQDMINFQNEWWNFIKNYSKRDQLSFMYLIWKHGIKTKEISINNTRLDHHNFFVFQHKKERQLHK